MNKKLVLTAVFAASVLGLSGCSCFQQTSGIWGNDSSGAMMKAGEFKLLLAPEKVWLRVSLMKTSASLAIRIRPIA